MSAAMHLDPARSTAMHPRTPRRFALIEPPQPPDRDGRVIADGIAWSDGRAITRVLQPRPGLREITEWADVSTLTNSGQSGVVLHWVDPPPPSLYEPFDAATSE